MTVPVEVEINAPTVEVEAPPVAPSVTEVDLNHESRITALEMAVGILIEAASEAQFTAEIAQSNAEMAQETASAAIDAAITAEVVAEETAEAVAEIAAETPDTTDDEIVEDVMTDVPARKPNLWYDPEPHKRLVKS